MTTQNFDSYFHRALDLFGKGRSSEAVALLDELALSEPDNISLKRRILSATGGFLIDCSNWREAELRLSAALELAEKLFDEEAIQSTRVNIASLHIALWRYSEVLRETNVFTKCLSKSPRLATCIAELHLNRAIAALALRNLSAATHDARIAFHRLRKLAGVAPTIYIVTAGSTYIRVLAQQGKLKQARAMIAALDKYTLKDRALSHRQLSHAAIATESGQLDIARTLLHSIDSSNAPPGVRHDALLLRLRVEQRSGDIAAALNVLSKLGDIVISHRSSQVLDALDIDYKSMLHPLHEIASSKDSETMKWNQRDHYPAIANIVQASELPLFFLMRRAAAVFAYHLATRLGHGTLFAAAIARGIVICDFGALSFGESTSHSPALSQQALRVTLSIFDALKMPRDNPEYRIAAFRFERNDGKGLLGVSGKDIPKEAAIANLAINAVALLHDAEGDEVSFATLAGQSSPTLIAEATTLADNLIKTGTYRDSTSFAALYASLPLVTADCASP